MALRRLRRAVAYALVSWHVVVGYYTLFGHYCWGVLGQTRDRMGNQISLKFYEIRMYVCEYALRARA